MGNVAGSSSYSEYFQADSEGIKCLKAGEVQVHGLAFMATGFTAADIIHLRFVKNTSNFGGDVTIKMHNNAGGTIQNFAFTTVAAGDVIKLALWNESGARGQIAASTINRINIRYI